MHSIGLSPSCLDSKLISGQEKYAVIQNCQAAHLLENRQRLEKVNENMNAGMLSSIVVLIPAELSWLLNAAETIIRPKACSTGQLLAFFPTAVSSDWISAPTDLQWIAKKSLQKHRGILTIGYPCMPEYIQYEINS
ncbi:hypothetical protein GOODEAATRI_014994 [Goodea atripinnis]|uniref:Uncharacterized protein n=1 Tax=Goodea atripinnis TaxID=208336 RepID=A0ABV0NE12_9TELE